MQGIAAFQVTPRRLAWVVAALVLATASCDREGARELRPGTERPLVIVFSPQYTPRDPRALDAALEGASGLQIEVRTATSNEEAFDLVERRDADAGLMTLFDFLLCSELYRVAPLAQLVRHGDSVTQEGELLVRADSDVHDLAALRGRPVAFVDRYSVTGFLLTANVLHRASVEVVPLWVGTHAAVVDAVKRRRAVAGATYAGSADDDPELRVLARSRRVANEPLFVQSEVPEATRAALRRGLTSLGRDGATSSALEGLAGATGFREVPTGTYEAAIATIRTDGRHVEDMVEGGWIRANEHRRPLWSDAP
jgi:ABC-type phosphate/phosphonate transport system substrate-binding protein